MSTTPTPTVGTIHFAIPGIEKPCSTWYQLFGSVVTNTQPPVIVIHGGPGASWGYLSSLIDLHTRFGLTVIFYDAIGGGNSTHLPEKKGDVSFWTEALYLDEIENVLTHFGLGGAEGRTYDILGQSWGGMIGARFAAQTERVRLRGLRRLILCDAPSNMAAWISAGEEYKKLLPQKVQDTIAHHESAGTTDSQEYQDAVMVFYARHFCRCDPWPKDLADTFAEMGKDTTVYHTMNGINEIFITGSIKDWDVRPDIARITADTLIINGRWDTADDSAVLPFFQNLQRVKWVHFNNSSHCPFWEERDRFMEVVGGFLTS